MDRRAFLFFGSFSCNSSLVVAHGSESERERGRERAGEGGGEEIRDKGRERKSRERAELSVALFFPGKHSHFSPGRPLQRIRCSAFAGDPASVASENHPVAQIRSYLGPQTLIESI